MAFFLWDFFRFVKAKFIKFDSLSEHHGVGNHSSFTNEMMI